MAGNEFKKVDFHVHTSASLDYKDPQASPQQIVDSAVAAGLSAIVIADHNSHSGVAEIRDIAKKSGLVVFPGIELSTPAGHFLAVFDPEINLNVLDEVLTMCGIYNENRGKEDAMTTDVHRVMEIVVQKAGIVVAAHVDGPKGFLEAIDIGQEKIRIYSDLNLSSLEITVPQNKAEFAFGRRAGYSRRMPCVMGSDAHSPEQIGNRFSLIKVDNLNLRGLRHAFAEHELRLRNPDEFKQVLYPRVNKLRINAGFLAGQEINFNPQLTCLVGGAGSGKSTIIEFLRFGLNQVSDIGHVAEDNKGKLADLATAGATIEIELELQSGDKLLVSRQFNNHDNPTKITRLSDGSEISDIEIQGLFPIHAFSQGEAISISRNKLAQLGLIDQHIDIKAIQAERDSIYHELSSQISGLIKLMNVVENRQQHEKDLATTTEEMAQLTKELDAIQQANANPVVQQHKLWLLERGYMTAVGKSLQENEDLLDIEEKIQDINLYISRIQLPAEETPNKELLQKVSAQANKLNDLRNQARKTLLDGLQDISKDITSLGQAWKASYVTHEDEYKNVGLASGRDRLDVIHTRLEALMSLQARAKYELDQIALAQTTLSKQLERRKRLLEKLDACRTRIFEMRDRKTKEISKKLDDALHLGVVADGNSGEFEKMLLTGFKGSNVRQEDLRKIASSYNPKDFCKAIANSMKVELISKVGLTETAAQKLLDWCTFKPELLFEIEACQIEDRVDIYYRVAEGDYRLIDKLSTGQKATGIVLLSMVEGTSPIIFDQPEDALYTPNIYSYIVSTLRKEKDQRQFILATHNANIVLGGDFDHGIVLEGGSKQTEVKASGGIDDVETHSAMILHLEGGREAFAVRQQKWQIN